MRSFSSRSMTSNLMPPASIASLFVISGRLYWNSTLPSGMVERQRHLGVALVRAVAEAQEAAAVPRAVEEVEVHALVEVRLRPERVRVVVLRRDVAEDRNHARLQIQRRTSSRGVAR